MLTINPHTGRAYSKTQARVIAALQDGQVLHHEFGRNGSRWWLSSGATVNVNAARVITANPNIIGSGSWFGVPAQSWHWISPTTAYAMAKLDGILRSLCDAQSGHRDVKR
jgi:hypothetical protein